MVGAQDDGENIIGILKDGVGSLGAAAVLGVVVAGARGDDKHTIVWAGNDAVDEIVVTTQLLQHPIPAAAARARADCICKLQLADCICRLQVAGAGCRSGWCGDGQVNPQREAGESRQSHGRFPRPPNPRVRNFSWWLLIVQPVVSGGCLGGRQVDCCWPHTAGGQVGRLAVGWPQPRVCTQIPFQWFCLSRILGILIRLLCASGKIHSRLKRTFWGLLKRKRKSLASYHTACVTLLKEGFFLLFFVVSETLFCVFYMEVFFLFLPLITQLSVFHLKRTFLFSPPQGFTCNARRGFFTAVGCFQLVSLSWIWVVHLNSMGNQSSALRLEWASPHKAFLSPQFRLIICFLTFKYFSPLLD